jgi:hypothetical protein
MAEALFAPSTTGGQVPSRKKEKREEGEGAFVFRGLVRLRRDCATRLEERRPVGTEEREDIIRPCSPFAKKLRRDRQGREEGRKGGGHSASMGRSTHGYE